MDDGDLRMAVGVATAFDPKISSTVYTGCQAVIKKMLNAVWHFFWWVICIYSLYLLCYQIKIDYQIKWRSWFWGAMWFIEENHTLVRET